MRLIVWVDHDIDKSVLLEQVVQVYEPVREEGLAAEIDPSGHSATQWSTAFFDTFDGSVTPNRSVFITTSVLAAPNGSGQFIAHGIVRSRRAAKRRTALRTMSLDPGRNRSMRRNRLTRSFPVSGLAPRNPR
jgi:hypothetical protein